MEERRESYLQGIPAILGEGAQGVPLLTDLLAACVHTRGVVVVQLAEDQEEEEQSAPQGVTFDKHFPPHPPSLSATSFPQPSQSIYALLELLGDGSNLFYTVLVGSQVALKGLVFLEQSLHLRQGGRLKVLLGQHGLLTYTTPRDPQEQLFRCVEAT